MELVRQESQLDDPKLEAIAAAVCAAVFRGKAAGGQRAMGMSELRKAAALPPAQLEKATLWAVEHAWLRRGLDIVELRAAGIYVAKRTLQLPR